MVGKVEADKTAGPAAEAMLPAQAAEAMLPLQQGQQAAETRVMMPLHVCKQAGADVGVHKQTLRSEVVPRMVQADPEAAVTLVGLRVNNRKA